MPNLSIDRTYGDGDTLFKADLDNITDAVEALNNTTKYDDDNLQSEAITRSKIVDGTVTTGILGAGCITTAKLATAAVSTAQLGTGAVTTSKIADGAVTNAKLAIPAVTTAKYDTSTRLSASKIVAKYYGADNAGGSTAVTYGTGATAFISHTTTSTIYRPCLIMLQSIAGEYGYIQIFKCVDSTASTCRGVSAQVDIKVGATTVSSQQFGITTGDDLLGNEQTVRLPLSAFKHIYTSQINSGTVISAELSIVGGTTGDIVYAIKPKIVVLEL
jgi:hypothetical protein